MVRFVLLASAMSIVGCGSPHECEGTYHVENQPDLDEVRSCTRVTGDLVFAAEGLSEIKMARLESVDGSFGVHMSGLQHIDFPKLTRVGKGVGLSGRNAFSNLNGLRSLVRIGASYAGDSLLIALLNLSEMSGLANIESIRGSLIIESTEALTGLAGLPDVDSVGGIRIEENQSLVSLDALAGIVSIDGDVEINDNTVLSTLGMTALTRIAGDLVIVNNPSLPTCAAEALVAQLVDFTGDVTISGNDDTAMCD